MKARRWRRRGHQQEADLNVTAFLNLMVILVPFLLVTAVFSRVAIIELMLPAPGDPALASAERELRLEITIRADRLEVANAGGTPVLIPRREADYNYKSLADVLKSLKAEFPEQTDATILLEPEIPYEVLVQVMDATMTASIVQPGSVTRIELFPAVSIGDAPPRAADRDGGA